MRTSLGAVDWGIVARGIHILAVVVWIGGVWFVTTVFLPAMRKKPAGKWIDEFDEVERRFAPQAQISVLLVLLSGIYMLYEYDLWDRFTQGAFWWMHLMVCGWLIFALLLFLIEPLMLDRMIRKSAATNPQVTLTRILRLHQVILAFSLIAAFAAVCGAHGLF